MNSSLLRPHPGPGADTHAEPRVQFHRRLARFSQKRLQPRCGPGSWREDLQEELEMRALENQFVENERALVRSWLDTLPTDVEGFMQWFEALVSNGPGQNDPLFEGLAERATLEQMRAFLQQEIAGEAGFDDLVALTQVRFPARPKLEMANNYWDEMGRGREPAMHARLLQCCADSLGLEARIEATLWEPLALGNLMVALACNRRYAYQSVGALGVIEMTAPDRVACVNAGLKRLGVAAPARAYFQLHAGLDRRHSEAWNREVIAPLVAADPALARPIAEGALMRLNAGARCYERYRRGLGLSWAAATAAAA